MVRLRVLNLGAGVQSTALAIMAQINAEARAAGDPYPYPLVGEFQCAIFGDTGDEPWAVYMHLVWLAKRCSSFRILVRSIHPKRNRILHRLFPNDGPVHPKATRFLAWLRRIEIGTLRGSLKSGVNSTGGRFASIPAYTWDGQTVRMTRGGDLVPNEGKTRRRPRQRVPKGVHIEQVFGLSFDEPSRVRKTRARFEAIPWATALFPLFDLEQTRGGCIAWLKKYGPPYSVERSACTHCPLRGNIEWRAMRDNDPVSWEEACQVDEALRTSGAAANRDMTQTMYLHRTCKPLRIAPIDEPETRKLQEVFGFAAECLGLCGT